jgi:hypothetical protein
MPPLLKFLSEIMKTVRSTLKRLEARIDNGTIRLAYLALVMLVVFEAILVSLLIAFIILRSI